MAKEIIISVKPKGGGGTGMLAENAFFQNVVGLMRRQMRDKNLVKADSLIYFVGLDRSRARSVSISTAQFIIDIVFQT
jgi:hypothetical protein